MTNKKQKVAKDAKLLKAARAVAASLFIDGCGRRAQRLVFEHATPPIVGGGWCETAAADQIYQTLVRLKVKAADKRRTPKPAAQK